MDGSQFRVTEKKVASFRSGFPKRISCEAAMVRSMLRPDVKLSSARHWMFSFLSNYYWHTLH